MAENGILALMLRETRLSGDTPLWKTFWETASIIKEVLLPTEELAVGLGIMEGCAHPILGGEHPEDLLPCGDGLDTWESLRWLLSSFNVSWSINMFSNDSPGGQTSWSPRWSVKEKKRKRKKYCQLSSLADSGWIGHFWVPKTLPFKMRPSAQPFLWRWVLFAWEWKTISIWKAEHLTSFLYRGPGGNWEMAYWMHILDLGKNTGCFAA